MERMTRGRASLLATLFCLIALFFAVRMFDLQVVQTGGRQDNEKTFTTWTRVKAARGDILDCYGNVLVSNRASYDLTLNNFVILNADGTNDLLLQLVDRCRELDVEYIDHFPLTKEPPFAYTLSDYNSTWQGYFQAYLPVVAGGLDSDISAALLMKKLRTAYNIPENWSDEDARAVIGLRYELRLRQELTNLPTYVFMEDVASDDLAAIMELGIPGLRAEASTVREYNTTYAAHILGNVAAMNEEQWAYYKTLKDENGQAIYDMAAHVGQSGLEQAFEEYLHGIDGTRVDVVFADGTIKSQHYLDGKEPKAGQNVKLTIDLNLQMAAEDSMAQLIEGLRAQAAPEGEKKVDGSDIEGGAVVAMNVKTGEILACASYPTYNLGTFSEDFEELKEAPYAPLFNRALQAAYPPGSTYKMSMVIAGISSGVINSDTRIRDMGVFTKYNGFSPKCLAWSSSHSVHGGTTGITAAEAISASCNYFFYVVGDEISLSIMDATAKGLGLGESTGVELAEVTGHRANAETRAKLYKGSEANWYPADQVMAAIGQSDNLFSPLQLCVYTCTLANKGLRLKATFLDQVVSADFRELIVDNQPKTLSTMEIPDEAYNAYLEGMRMAARTGTGRRTFANYPIDVAVKTGTAQHGLGKQYSDHGAAVCFAPADDPEIAVVVYGEKGGHGSTMCEIAKAVLDVYFADTEGEILTGENALG